MNVRYEYSGGKSPESRINQLRKVVPEIINEVLNEIDSKYGDDVHISEQRPYHNRAHTYAVVDRTGRLLWAAHKADSNLVKEEDIYIGMIAAAFHDVVQERGAEKGSNEKKSIKVAHEWMEKFNKQNSSTIFTSTHKNVVKNAILGTIPDFNGKTVTQPNVTRNSPVITRMVALADLGAAGMLNALEGSDELDPDSTVGDNVKLFLEEKNNQDFIKKMRSGESLSNGYKRTWREKMVKSAKSQIDFVKGRMELFENEIAGFNSSVKNAIRGEFKYFDFSLQQAEEFYTQAKDASFDELIDMFDVEESVAEHL